MPRLRSASALSLVLVVAVAGGAGAQAAPAPAARGPAAERPVTDVIVQWRDDVPPSARDAVRRAVGLARGAPLPLARTEVTAVPRGQSAEQVARRLAADPRVAFAEPDAWLLPSSTDPFFPLQWGLDNTGQEIGFEPGTPDVDINAPEAWAAYEGQPGEPVVVAVTDSGVDVSHPELVDRLWVNADEPVNGLDDDGNGLVDDLHGWNFVTDSPVLFDDAVQDAHGTHVAGTVGALRDNGVGVAGTTERALLLPVKFIGPEGGATSDAVRAIAYASEQGASVINASWGGPDNSQALQRAIADSPAVVVAAAGNDGKDNDVEPDFPASYRLSNVLSVTAVDHDGELPRFGNRGLLSVDLAGPGVDVGSTLPDGGYGPFNGTSMAAPHVAGVAAMVRSLRPDLTAGEVVSLVKNTVRPLESLRLTTSTGGMVDAEGAVLAALAGASPGPEADVLLPPTSGRRTAAQPDEACPDGIPSSAFSDVIGNVHADAIDCGVWYALIRGTTATTFSPQLAVTRGQTASLLAGLVDRAGRLPATAPDAFDDDAGSPHEDNIDKLASLGVISGVGGRSFAPELPVTRGQIATLLVGVHELLTGSRLRAGLTPFLDIRTDTHRESIEKAYTAGLVRGSSLTAYSPRGSTRRDQAASLVVRELEALVADGAVPSKG